MSTRIGFPLTQHLVELGIFAKNPFTLVDVGCRGGIHERWRTFRHDLRAYAIDPLIYEIEKLSEAEENPYVKYWAGYIGLPDNHPVVLGRASKGPWANVTWDRLSAAWAAEILSRETDDESTRLARNEWQEAALAESSNRLGLSEFVTQQETGSVDFVKIDVDGEDLYILHSGEEVMQSQQVLGFELEVNFFGTECETDNTFHNTDRHMRAHGYALFDLSVRRYSKRSMPAPFLLDMPAQTEWGAPFQGDAFYARDVVAEAKSSAIQMPPVQMLKLVALHELFGLPDCAAEILISFEKDFADIIDVNQALDLLTPQVQSTLTTHEEYRSAFAEDPTSFYPAKPQQVYQAPDTLRARLGRLKRRLLR